MKALLVFLFLSSAQAAIPVISFDGSDEKIVGTLSPSEYQQSLITTEETLQKEMLEGMSQEKDTVWKLNQIVIGLGASGEIGIGPWKLGTNVKQRFIYVRKP